MIFSLGGIALLLIILAIGLASCRGRYTTAPFTSETLQPSVLEIRNYPELAIATTSMAEPAGNNAFDRFFRCISENNTAKQKILMPTPVFIGDLGE